VFCSGQDLSHEHVIPRWLREKLRIQGSVQEHLEFGPPRKWNTLALVFSEVCVKCNTGWLSRAEDRARPVLEPMLFGDCAISLNAMQQAKLAKWAVKTSLLIALKKSGNKPTGWVPSRSMSWLCQNPDSDEPPPGTYVWLGCLNTESMIVSYMQSGVLFDDDREPIGHVGMFSVGCVLFQVFCVEPGAAEYSEDRDGYFVPQDLRAGLVSIWPSKMVVHWPPVARFTGSSLRSLAERNRQGLGLSINGAAGSASYQSWPSFN
jgi:hypothetical protein